MYSVLPPQFLRRPLSFGEVVPPLPMIGVVLYLAELRLAQHCNGKAAGPINMMKIKIDIVKSMMKTKIDIVKSI